MIGTVEKVDRNPPKARITIIVEDRDRGTADDLARMSPGDSVAVARFDLRDLVEKRVRELVDAAFPEPEAAEDTGS